MGEVPFFLGGGGGLAYNRLFPPTFYPTINRGLSGTRIYSVKEIPKKKTRNAQIPVQYFFKKEIARKRDRDLLAPHPILDPEHFPA